MFLLRAVILCSSVALTLEGNVPCCGRPPSRSQNSDTGTSSAASTTQSASSSSGPATRLPSPSAASPSVAPLSAASTPSSEHRDYYYDWAPASLPWMVSLGERRRGVHHHLCTGSLAFIDNVRAGRLVLTTATCAQQINGTEEAQAMLHDGRIVNIVKNQWNEQYLVVDAILMGAAITGNPNFAMEIGSNMLRHSDIGVMALEEQFRDRTISFVMQRNYYPTGPAMIASWRNVGRGEYETVQKNVTVVDPASCKDALQRALHGSLDLVFYRVLIDRASILCVSGAERAELGTPLFLTDSRHSLLGMAVQRMDEYMAFINLHNDIHKGVISVLVERLIQQMNAANE